MKKNFMDHKNTRKLRDWWRNLYSSTKLRMSRGAQFIDKTITWPSGDNWRRKNKKK